MDNKVKTKLKNLTGDQMFTLLAWIGVIATTAVVAALVFYFTHFSGELSNKQEDWGTFGDFLGGSLNPILSFLGLIALLLTIVLQNRELEATRQELARSAEAQINSEAALSQQSEILEQQRFESTFFQLVNLYNEIVKSMQVNHLSRSIEGRECFFILYSQRYVGSSGTTLDYVYDNFYREHRSEIGHYFRHVYQIINFIDKSNISNKKQYSNFIRAQLSDYELVLLFINGLSIHARDKMKPLIEKYELFEHLSIDLFEFGVERAKEYEISAFGKSSDIENIRKLFV
ncbi:putative phage abortive infection protein [Vibrio renipiscarius]|uniref:putative phage abortive infection protein n=1 Tax=Vibrio renipiscarius TaxID=1461322 RepID=UPI00069B5F84|nr:putative phage abortive infection protein [Vibrio renipiscarius]